jgi:hypothetical protein
LFLLILAGGCGRSPAPAQLSAAEEAAIADTLRTLLVRTYTFDQPDVVRRFMQLYPESGSVVSAASGSFTTSRDSLQAGLQAFWDGAGRYMQQPRWVWGPMAIDVLASNAAVVTARYTVPHWTPAGEPHVIGGAWTTVWTKRNGRWVIVQEHLSDLPAVIRDSLAARLRPSQRHTVR